jgi:hypothetical protein
MPEMKSLFERVDDPVALEKLLLPAWRLCCLGRLGGLRLG